ncbi:MAG: hypothetical protein A4E34_02718 [Methanoregula sp. PtaU1.Bin006]|nr:MAG: hypothetical protein A4E33_00495 [Methanoregula sp. PtaB.Bin085]OPY32343.1 MAG: hypothetical protein A4E34_02718 [Methanoregula sp. PtaU1.Bin006]
MIMRVETAIPPIKMNGRRPRGGALAAAFNYHFSGTRSGPAVPRSGPDAGCHHNYPTFWKLPSFGRKQSFIPVSAKKKNYPVRVTCRPLLSTFVTMAIFRPTGFRIFSMVF